uniref:ABC transporter ATP-binding protein n=2 Tax=Staphylothermus marinus TaxID=2280 RepID=A0A7C4HCY8_STAMA
MSSNSSLTLLRSFLREMFIYKKLLFLTILSIIGASITTLISPYIIGLTIDEYVLKGRFSELGYIVFILLITLIAQWFFTTLRGYITEVFSQRVLYNMRNKLFNKLLYLHIDFYKNKQIGDLVSRVINDTSTLNEVLVSGILNVIGDILTIIGVFIAMLVLSPRLTLVSMATIPLMIFVAKFFGTRLRHAYRETRERVAQLSSVVSESVAGIEAIKAFGREKSFVSEFDSVSRDTMRAYIRVAVLMGFFWPLMNLASILSVIIVLIYGGYLSLTGALSIGVLIAFIQYIQRFIQPINNITSMYDLLQSAFASLDRIYEVLRAQNVEEIDKGRGVDKLRGEIVFKNVWFEYEPGRPVLKNISFTIKPGELIALVGHTGAGKTTLVNLLMKFYKPVRGEILIDGVNIEEIKLEDLRRRISYVPQETYLFTGTVLDNIKIGKPGATDEEVIKICKELGIHDFIEKLPNGYYTDAGEAGRRLSVGEKQLISIARAMLRNPDIVILDEALSSIDPKTEEMIRKAIKKLMMNRTGIIVAHRLTITRDCSRILVLDNGEIVEDGTFDELLAKRGLFYELYVTQLKREKTLSEELLVEASSG